MKIIVDVMSGDNAPLELIRGVKASAAENPDVEYIMVGDSDIVSKIASDNEIDISQFELVHSTEVITMEDDPLSATKGKTDSSMSVGLRMLADGKGDAFISAGNTGALFTGASLIVRRASGVRRAAIGAVLPMSPPVLLLDSGANINVTAEYLLQFAVMGSAYMRTIHGVEKPRVGLLNNGAEETKGTELQLEAYKLLSACPLINFVGNVEGNMVMRDKCDVLVTDGFTGNVLLKSIEGMGKMMLLTMKDLFYKNPKTMMAAMLVKSDIADIKKKFDPSEYGGAPILGIAKPVIKAHGSSKEKSFKSALRQAIFCARTGMAEAISGDMTELSRLRKEEKAAQKVSEEN
ncbi:MAG: phosphate acyltransferase PlsX [Ruminococcaceae bacterium]|nr:phosphate acyltransferase PlsX [Oscillospiraceae bacterium]